MSPFSYSKAISFLSLYPKIYKEVFRTHAKDPKEMVKYLPPIPQDSAKSVIWFVNYLLLNYDKLYRFIDNFARLDSEMLAGNYQIANGIIDSIRNEFGESLILQSREIRLRRETSDIKSFTQDIDKKVKSYGNCVASIIVRITGRVYSDEFSHRNFENDTNKFISTVTPIELRPFLSYWLLNRKNISADTNKILATAASSSIYDLFFVLTDLISSKDLADKDKTGKISYLFSLFFNNCIDGITEHISVSNEEYLDNIVYYGNDEPSGSEIEFRSSIRSNLSDHINNVFVRAFSNKFNPMGRCFEINFSRYDKNSGEFSDAFNHLIENFKHWLALSEIDIAKMHYVGTMLGISFSNSEKSIHASAVQALRLNLFDDAMMSIEKLGSRGDIVRDILVCEIFRRQGNLDALVAVCSDLIVENLEYSYILPLNNVFSERWRLISKANDKLSLTICLFGLYLSSPTRGALRNLRYSWSDALSTFGVSLPSAIEFNGDHITNRKITFFLRYICTVEVMETHRSFQKTRDIEEEMRSVYANLIQNDFNNEDYYQQQILLITTKLKIEDAIKKMDRSRIFVDIGMLISWAENNIGDTLRRFNVVADREFKDVEEIFSNTIKSGNSKKGDEPIVVYVSSHESNLILANLINSIRENYLNSNDYGLDAYLSMRIRHGSFSGQLRSPLQNNNMIAYLSESNIYFYHSAWYGTEDLQRRRQVDEKVIDFSRKFDVLIEDFLNNKLRIRNEDKPNGFFDINLSDEDVMEIKSVALRETSIARFILEISVIFREKINECLVIARKELEEYLKPEILSLLYNLRLEIDSIIERDHADNFILNYENTIKELNIAFARVVEWFDFNAEFEKNSDLSFREYVDLFIESAHYAHVDFGMEPNIDIDFAHSFDSMTIYRLNDIFFTLADNMYKYSGMLNPKVDLTFRMIGESMLQMTFLSQIRNEIDKDEIENRTNEILDRILGGEILPQTKSEGRSGLIKIANSVRLSGGDIIYIGLNDEKNRYVVDLKLGVKLESSDR